jgi:Na+-translocating ferredoxin:NAD+ oxidoreductase RnfC subunit
MRKGREIPIKRLYTQLGLAPYDRKAPFVRFDWRPKTVSIPLNSHVGAPAKAAVKKGDLVKRGDVIGTVEESQLGCPVHASVDGRVTAVGPQRIEITT